MDDLIKKF